MTRHLIMCEGWIGDILFTASIAKHLKQMNSNDYVAIWIPLVQPQKVLEQNPFIDEVVYGYDKMAVIPHFDIPYQMPVLKQDMPATIQYQLAAGIPFENTTLPYDVYTVPDMDKEANEHVEKLRREGYYKPIVAYQSNWIERSLIYTPQEYESGEYKGTHRDLKKILDGLAKYVTLVEVGFPPSVNQYHPACADPVIFAKQASLIKFCDFMIGAEGGLTNLAAGVGTQVLMTTEHMFRMFGPRGQMAQYNNLAMGPKTYYPARGHVHFDPFISDDELLQQLIALTDK